MTSPDDHDVPDVPRQPPADPWLTEAHTAAFDPPTSYHHSPYPGGPPMADTMPLLEPRRRRPGRWIVAGLAALAVGVISVLIVDQFRADPGRDDPGASRPARSTPAVAGAPTAAASSNSSPLSARVQPADAGTDPASAAAGGTASSDPGNAGATSAAAGPRVVLEVTASGRQNIGDVSYTDENGDIIRRSGIPLPWRTSFTPLGRMPPLVIHAQRKSGGDSGPVTCTITVDGKLTTSATQRGRYAAPLC